MPAIAACQLHLIGPVRVERTRGGASPRFRSRRTQALLGYLAVSQRPVTREKLAALFWPDESSATGKANLRRELHNLSLIFPGCWRSDQSAVQFTPSPDTVIDIYEAQRLEANKEWAAAAHWLRGEFLEGVSVPNSPEFESWLTGERERWQQQMERVLLQAAQTYWMAGEVEMAQRMLQRLLRQIPWHEEGHRRLMLLLARRGRFGAALKQYRRCRQALTVELDAPPSAASDALHQRIKAAAEQLPIQLPPAAIPLVGREAEMALLRQRILDPNCRLMTITGLGGVGKSRLALAMVRNLAEGDGRRFLHGGAFVSLIGVPADQIARTIANAVGLSLSDRLPAEGQLLNYLKDKELLLLLDNYEHLLPATDLVEKILAEAPGITLLVTTTERLHLWEEWVFALDGLPCPEPGVSAADVATYDGVRLFVTVAERTGRPLTVVQHSEALREICQLVGGVPLALVLAAAWSETLTPAEIAAEIDRNLDFLRSRYRNMPPRQQSMQAVFDAAWARLTEPEQAVFAALSVFRAGFTEEAACQVTGADPALLTKLVERSLVVDEGNGRYTLHELLRRYADTQLQASEKTSAMRQSHLAYLVALAEACEAELDGPEQARWLNRLEADRQNVGAALAWALANEEIELAARLAGAMGGFWAIRGYLHEGRDWLDKILAYDSYLSAPVRAKVLFASGWLAFEAGEYGQARDYYAASLVDWRQTEKKDRIADLLNRLGHASQQLGKLVEAAALYEESLTLYQQLHNKKGIALALNRLGHVMQLMGEYDRATGLIADGLALRRELGDRRGMASSLNALAEMARMQGNNKEAVGFYRECLAICEEIGDKRCVAGLSHNLAHALHRLGEYEQAASLFQRGLLIYQELRNQEGTALCLAGLAGVWGTSGDPQLAARLFGAAEALLEANPYHLSPADRSAWQDNLAQLQTRLDRVSLQKAWNEGRSVSVSQVIEHALNGA